MIELTSYNYEFVETILNFLFGGLQQDDTYKIYVVTKNIKLLEIKLYDMHDCNHVKKYSSIYNFFLQNQYNPVPFYHIYNDGPDNFIYQ